MGSPLTLGVRVKPSRKSKLYREMYDELLLEIQTEINAEKADSDAQDAVHAIRRFVKRSPEHQEYALLILELWDA